MMANVIAFLALCVSSLTLLLWWFQRNSIAELSKHPRAEYAVGIAEKALAEVTGLREIEQKRDEDKRQKDCCDAVNAVLHWVHPYTNVLYNENTQQHLQSSMLCNNSYVKTNMLSVLGVVLNCLPSDCSVVLNELSGLETLLVSALSVNSSLDSNVRVADTQCCWVTIDKMLAHLRDVLVEHEFLHSDKRLSFHIWEPEESKKIQARTW